MAATAAAAAARRQILAGPTPVQGGMKELDTTKFTKTVVLRGLRINPKHCKTFMDQFKRQLLNIPRFRNIVPDPVGAGGKQGTKLLLLCPSIASSSDVTPEQQLKMTELGAELVDHEIELGFEYWTAEQILRAAMPPSITEITSSFETIGHIAHMNLRDKQLPYKTLIGQVIFQKNKGIRTVVNKMTGIDQKFRFFKMEVIAGDDDFETTVRESGCVFKMQYNQVYWNSRLHTEHDRIIQKLKKTDIVYDMFAGIGPFALPAGKKGCRVFANDLNPKSYEALCENVDLNHVGKVVKPFNMDGREFMRHMASLWGGDEPGAPDCDHILMNLPASAHEFLDVFRGLYKSREATMAASTLPIIHCYCFSSADDLKADAVKMCEEVMQGEIGEDIVDVHEVRDVAPKKRMMCVSFRLPPAIAFASAATDDDGNAAKRIKLG